MASLRAVISILLVISTCTPSPAQMPLSPFSSGSMGGMGGMGGMGANDGGAVSGGMPPAKRAANPKIPHKASSLDDLFKKTDTPEVVLPTLLLGKKDWGSFNENAQQSLMRSHFVVINDQRIKDFAQLYKMNSEEGKPSFITVDSIMHPLLAYRNAIKIKIIEQSCIPRLTHLLLSMIKSSIADYRAAEDPLVKDDVQRNLAYLAIAVKLLAPDTKLPDFGGVQELIDRSLVEITADKTDQSQPAELAVFRPIGWYKNKESLKRYYRCRQWLGRTAFLLSDTSDDRSAPNGNEFRRSVLLYRSLANAKMSDVKSFELWQQLNDAFTLLDDEHLCSNFLLPNNFRAVLNPSSVKAPQAEVNLDERISLKELSLPLARAKVLLALRSEHNRLMSRSIFELDSKSHRDNENLSFRFFPPCPLIESEWLVSQSPTGELYTGMPFSLLFLHSRRSPEADNVLADNVTRLDEQLCKSLPIMDRVLYDEDQLKLPSSIWPVLSAFWKFPPETAQPVMRTEIWQMHSLETSLATWIDSWLSVSAIDQPPSESKDNSEEQIEDSASKENAPTTASSTAVVRKPSRFNYLEPAHDVFRQLSKELTEWQAALTKINMFPADCRPRLDDFIRLTQRLSVIAKKESAGQPFNASDVDLLANFDTLLEKIATPVANNIYFSFGPPQAPSSPDKSEKTISPAAKPGSKVVQSAPQKKIPIKPAAKEASKESGKESSAASETEADIPGINLGLGTPATIYVALRTPRGPIVYRGAVYSFFEAHEMEISQAHWLRNLEFGFLRPPFWTESFHLANNAETNKAKTLNATGKQSPTKP